jgi:hypothetical protein
MALLGCWFPGPQKTEEEIKLDRQSRIYEYVQNLDAKIATDEVRLRMFYFCFRSYSNEYHILAKSKVEALQHLKQYCYKKDVEQFNSMIYAYPNGEYPNGHKFPTNVEEYVEVEGYRTKDYQDFLNGNGLILEFDEGIVLQTEVS